MRADRPGAGKRAGGLAPSRALRVLLPVFLLALAVAPQRAEAQYEKPPPASAYGLEDVTVVRADGSREAGVHVLVRDGVIQAMGDDVRIPPGARVLEGDSLRVYPGLVDAEGDVEYELPEPDTPRSEVASWSPPRDVQTFRPHLRLADHLTATGSSVSGHRTSGTVAAAVHPEDGLMPGRSALLLFRADAATPSQLVLEPGLGTVMELRPAPGVYPSTLFGAMAFFRQQFRNARHQARLAAAYAEDPAELAPPSWDADYRVLVRMADGETPAFFRAQSSNDIRRALDLSADLGLDPVIVGGREAWKVAERLAERDVAVLVSTDYPEPRRWDPETADSVRADTLPAEVQREKERIEDAYRNPGRLHEAGVRFALTSGGGEAELLEGARTAVEYGLPRRAALRALTAAPAELLGRPALASLRTGMSANFVVADGPLLEEGTDLLYTFVAGRPEVMRSEPGDEPKEAPSVDVSGRWSLEIETERGSFEGTLRLEQEGADVSGSVSSSEGPTLDVGGGSVSGNTLELTLTGSSGGQSFEMSLSGTVEGSEASGTGSGPFGSFTWEAERTSGPGAGVER